MKSHQPFGAEDFLATFFFYPLAKSVLPLTWRAARRAQGVDIIEQIMPWLLNSDEAGVTGDVQAKPRRPTRPHHPPCARGNALPPVCPGKRRADPPRAARSSS